MKSQGVRLRTRIKVGRNDLEFSLKYPNSGWKSEPLPAELPGIDLEAGRRSSLTTSPPPGRPDRGTSTSSSQLRKRPFSGSSDEEIVKKAKEAPNKDKVVNMQGVNQVLQVMLGKQNSQELQGSKQKTSTTSNPNKDDPGQFTNTEGYCPSTPAKAKTIPDLTVVINSPIFHNKANISK